MSARLRNPFLTAGLAAAMLLLFPRPGTAEDYCEANDLATVTARVAAIDQPITVYHAQPLWHQDPLRHTVVPEMFVDVTDIVDQKVDMLACHVSQKKWLDESQGHDSYLETLRDLDRQCGKMSGKFEFAEGWRRHLYLGFCGPEDDPLSDALAARVMQRETI